MVRGSLSAELSSPLASSELRRSSELSSLPALSSRLAELSSRLAELSSRLPALSSRLAELGAPEELGALLSRLPALSSLSSRLPALSSRLAELVGTRIGRDGGS